MANTIKDRELTEITPAGARNDKIIKILVGVVLVLAIAVSLVGAAQFAKSTYPSCNSSTVNPESSSSSSSSQSSKCFRAPFFVTWFNAIWLMVCYPAYLLVMLLNCRRKQTFREIWRQSESVYGSDGLTWRKVFTHCGTFSVLGVATNYAYLRALEDRAPSDITAMFASNCVFVFLLSAALLNARLISLKLISVVLAGTGVFLIAYADWSGLASLTAVFLILLSAFGAACYTISFKRIVGNARPDQVCLFLTLVATFTAVVLWPVILILHYTAEEEIIPELIPWPYMMGSCTLGVAFNFLLNFGVAFTYPLFAAFGGIVAIPLNFVADLLFRGVDYQYTNFAFKASGAVLVIVAFVWIAVLPESLDDRCYACVTRANRRHRRPNDAAPEEMEQLKRRNNQPAST
ncbi:putative thiamine transporter SLC35F3 [Hypsibius exemplaris]|uniref:Thiamine transporter SLC35F3 n=1 Tax=Hypsibius exemplaris TaxID=2072580 RepID=A0A1W0WDI6_HYPEX|nr:putative thiamine transporter SLC35F3 [Hypsibius exemplaris]